LGLTKINPEDIEIFISDISGEVVITVENKKDCEQIKQQILSNDMIVEALKAEIERRKNQTITLNDGYIDMCNSWIDKLLQSIINSGGK
jgi:uncharacterized protein YhaN